MNIKKLLIALLLTVRVSDVGFGQAEFTNAPVWQATLRVTDENGNPILQANAFADYYVQPPPGETEAGTKKTGLTDTNGLITFTAHSGPSMGYGVDKIGYYSSGNLEYDFDFRNKTGGRWHPWDPVLNIVLKKMVNPIPMYAKIIRGGPPVFNQSVGYDLMAGEWVAPNGKGQITDIIFTGDLNKKSKNDFDYKLTVSFPNPGDGIQEFSALGGGLKSPYGSPADGYQPQVVRTMSRHPGEGTKDDSDGGRNYFFRVRTVLDEKGNVKSALYGKIYGDFMQFTYYLNPTPNDRNMEFDPKHNLMNLAPREIPVRTP